MKLELPCKTSAQAAPVEPVLVLVVDDSRVQRRILCKSLTRWGYEVMEASTGEAALALCRERMPQIVLSDWMMPGLSGLEFCRAFRTLSQDQYGYFILLTAKSDKAEVARGLDAGADDFLTKPVNNSELRARMTAGQRILNMQRELTQKNHLISETLGELQRTQAVIEKDLIEAKKLQQSLIRERYRALDGGNLSMMLRSAGHVGGDLVGYFPVCPGQLGLFGLDVSGHGISSALMTARLAGYLSATAPDQNVALSLQPDGSYAARPPREVIEELNDLVLDEMDTEHYFTLILAIVDLSSGAVTIAQAGHPHPALLRNDGRIEQNGTGGFPVGLLSGVKFDQFEVQMSQGDRLLLLSDGVTECPDRAGNMLGEAGLAEMLTDLRRFSGPALLSALVWNLSEFAGNREFPDDVSGILFEYLGPQPR